MRKRLLDSVVDYLYRRSQHAVNAEERDAYTYALAILGAVRRCDPDPLTSAAYEAFGSTFKLYLKRRAERQWRQHQEYVRCIPDYDPEEARRAQVVETMEVGGQQTGPGRMHTLSPKAVVAVEKSVRGLPRAPKKALGAG